MPEVWHLSRFGSRPDSASSPFGQWRWLDAWSGSVREGDSLRMIEDGHGEGWGGFALCVRDNVVRLAGDGLSDFGHVLGSPVGASAALESHLAQEDRVTSLSELSTADVAQLIKRVRRPSEVKVSSWCPQVDLKAWDEEAFTGRVGRTLRNARRVLDQPQLEHTVLRWPGPTAVASVISLSRTHVTRTLNALEDQAVRDFVYQYWCKPSPAGSSAIPCVSLLHHDGELVSGFLCIEQNESLYYYLVGSVRRKERYGIVHLLALVDWMRQAGIGILHLLRGMERYKTDIATSIEPRLAVTWGLEN